MSDKKRIASNSFFLLILTFSNYFLSLLLYPYLTRTLSIESFGLFGFVTSFIVLFQVIIEFGFMISTTASISKYRSDIKRVSEIVSATIQAKILLGFVSLALFLVTAFFVPVVREHFLFALLFFISSAITAMIPDFFYRGTEKMKPITTRTLSVRALMIILIIVFVKDDSQLLMIPLSFITANIIALLIALFGMKKAGVRLHWVRTEQTILAIKESSVFFLSRLAVSVNQSLGSLFLAFKFGPASIELGLLAGASKISTASEMPIIAVSDSLYPHMVNKKDYSLFFKALSLGGVIWFFVCLTLWVFAPQICAIILGPDYIQAGDVLRVLIFGNFMALFANWFGYPALSPIGLAKHANIALIVSAAINVSACLILWLADAISLFSICLVIAGGNLVVFGYRGAIFLKNRHLAE